jgi:hypothetical protein
LKDNDTDGAVMKPVNWTIPQKLELAGLVKGFNFKAREA